MLDYWGADVQPVCPILERSMQNVTLITRANEAQDITGVTHILLLHVDTLKTYFFDVC